MPLLPFSSTRWPTIAYAMAVIAMMLSGCTTSSREQPQAKVSTEEAVHYMGSDTCIGCHQEAHDKWHGTWMARTVRPPTEAELALIDDSILCGGIDVDYVLGGRLALRYLQKRDDHYVFLPCEWDPIERQVQPFRADDWPTFSFNERCAVCHTTDFNPKTTEWMEMGVGCESCHGPASRHGDFTSAGSMVQYGEISAVEEGMICSACHLQGGFSLKSDRRYPEGYIPGMDLFSIYEFPWDTLPLGSPTEAEADANPVDVHQKVLMKHQLDGTSTLRCTDCHTVHEDDHTKHQSLSRQDFCYHCHEYTPDGQFDLKDYQVTCPICEF